MNDPTQQEEPEYAGKNELNDGYEKAPLEQLAKSRDEEAAESCYDVPSRSLCHVLSKLKCMIVHLTPGV